MRYRIAQFRYVNLLLLAAAAATAACSGQDVLAPTVARFGNTDSTGPTTGPAKVAVYPKSMSIAAAQSYHFTAWERKSARDSSSVPVTWSASGGAVRGDGTFTAGTSSGQVLVVARTSQGYADTAVVNVVTGDNLVLPKQGECANRKSSWIWCDDFEQDRLASYFEYSSAGGSFSRTGGVGVGGSTGMRAHWNRGVQDAGFLHLAFGRTPQAGMRPVDQGSAVYREVYWRLYVKNQEGWTGGGADKLTRAVSLASSTSYAEAAFAHVWSGNSGQANNDRLVIDPASGTDEAGNLQTTTYNDFPHMRWLGTVPTRTPIFDASHTGLWHCVEAHVRLNSAGNSDGLFEVWVDGSAEAQKTGLNFVGNASYGINAVYIENYWNGIGGAGASASEDRYIDNLVVSTGRIGC